jgi:hypothetical protein
VIVFEKKKQKKKKLCTKTPKNKNVRKQFFWNKLWSVSLSYEIIPNNFEKTEHLKDWYYQVFHWLFEITKEFE